MLSRPNFDLCHFLENQIWNLRFHIKKKLHGRQENCEENEMVKHGYLGGLSMIY